MVASLRRRVEASKHASNQAYHLGADATLNLRRVRSLVAEMALVSYMPLARRAGFNYYRARVLFLTVRLRI